MKEFEKGLAEPGDMGTGKKKSKKRDNQKHIFFSPTPKFAYCFCYDINVYAFVYHNFKKQFPLTKKA